MTIQYITHWQDIYNRHPGVYRKMAMQCEQFTRNSIQLEKIDIPFLSKYMKIFPWTSASLDWDRYCINSEVDAIYVRYCLSSYPFIRMLRNIKAKNRRIKVIVEIPTYPYAQEQSIKQIVLTIKDTIFRKKLYKYVDRIVVFSKEREIFGIPTIRTVNGIEVDSIAKKKTLPDLIEIHIISVASLAKWHGYDRLLKGLANYYQNGGNRKIIYHCVGDGVVLEEYRKIVEKNNLQEHVVFHGRQTGKELDSIYDQCTLGVEVLGGHRKGCALSSTLKSREYWAKGLPFITECEFPPEVQEIDQYIMKVPYDESPIDIEKVIEFYDNLYLYSGKSQEEIIDEIRDFAYHTCDMSVTMKPIIDYIKSDER